MPFQRSFSTPVWTEDLLRRSLLEEDIVDVHFHLFSSRSKSSRRVLRPRMLNSNTTLLKNGAKYFTDLFNSDTITSGPKTVYITASDGIYDGLPVSDYGYESDSDLEDEHDGNTEGDCFKKNPSVRKCLGTTSSPDEFKHKERSDTKIAHANDTPPLSEKGCHIFVKDIAFQTWYCLVYSLYIGVIDFAPLRSSGARGSQIVCLNARQTPQCSPKSMYALATKLGLNPLRDLAFAFIRENLNENNVLQELACSFVGRYREVLELELDLLVEKLATFPVIQGLPQLVRRIARNELSHGADILIGLHTRILQKHYWSAPSLPAVTGSSIKPTTSVSTTQAAATVPSSQPALVSSSSVSNLFTSTPTASSGSLLSLPAVTGLLAKPATSASTVQSATAVPSTQPALGLSSGTSTLFTSTLTASSANAPQTFSFSTEKTYGSFFDYPGKTK
ncbi:hypothetical protein EDC04DRAFT_3090475 [Pisolithus marmoratus]|nr:hypothetical protein EDC04DRAFT_3090475 [Pisolithus marmoratus]